MGRQCQYQRSLGIDLPTFWGLSPEPQSPQCVITVAETEFVTSPQPLGLHISLEEG